MEYTVAELVSEVRMAMDLNSPSESLLAADTDAQSLDALIESKIEDAARVITSKAPMGLLDIHKDFSRDTIEWLDTEKKTGRIELVDDFLRLGSFRMSDWPYAVHTYITADSPLYALQKSKFAGVRGNPEKPVVAVVSVAHSRMLEFYSCNGVVDGEEPVVAEASYIPAPVITNGKIEIGTLIKNAVVYYCAYLVCLTLGEADRAALFLGIIKDLVEE